MRAKWIKLFLATRAEKKFETRKNVLKKRKKEKQKKK